jgi:hypothetical protein
VRLLLILLWLLAPGIVYAQNTKPADQQAFQKSYESFQKGQYKKARGDLTRLYNALENKDPLKRKAALFIGMCLDCEQKYEDAIDWYKVLISTFPKSKTAINARSNIDRLNRSSGGHFDKLRLQVRVRLLLDKGSFAQALKAVQNEKLALTEDELEKQPLQAEDGELYYLLGECQRGLENYQEAAWAYECASRIGIPDAEEFRDRSLRYIVRRRALWLAVLLAGVLFITLLRARPWIVWSKAKLRTVALILGAWALMGFAFWLAGLSMNISEDANKPIFVKDIVMLIGVLAVPIVATALFAMTLDSKKSLRSIKIGLYGLSSAIATMALILHFKDWFMLLSL